MAKKKVNRPIAYTGGIGQYPRPSYFGLEGPWWAQIERYSNEIVDIQEHCRKVSSRMAELRNELEYQQREHETAPQVQAARLNKVEPYDRYLKLTQAIRLVEQDIINFMRAGVPAEVLDELYACGPRHASSPGGIAVRGLGRKWTNSL